MACRLPRARSSGWPTTEQPQVSKESSVAATLWIRTTARQSRPGGRVAPPPWVARNGWKRSAPHPIIESVDHGLTDAESGRSGSEFLDRNNPAELSGDLRYNSLMAVVG